MSLSFAKFKALTRFEQSLFGLPFVLTAVLLPFGDPTFFATLTQKEWLRLLFVIPAFFSARISGMAFNQLIDRKIDALNPRTCNRPLPSALVSPKQAASVAVIALFSLFFFSFCIRYQCFLISLIAAFFLCIYSYMKRVHFSCHVVLGIIHFLSPVTAYLAIKGRVDLPAILLGCIAFFSIAASDIIYAIQDYGFDQKHNLHSIPSRFGLEKGLLVAKIFHAMCFPCLIFFGLSLPVSGVYFFIIPFIFLCFFYFYRNWRRDFRAFFFCSVGVSMSVFVFTAISLLI